MTLEHLARTIAKARYGTDGCDDSEHAAIVDQLRSRGWGRLDAIERADELMAERTERRAIAQPDGAQ